MIDDDRPMTTARRELLVRLERIMSSNVCNVTAKTHAGALWIRRFPITHFDPEGKKTSITSGTIPDSISDECLMHGRYIFGANHLHVIRGLYEILTHLEEHCGLAILGK